MTNSETALVRGADTVTIHVKDVANKVQQLKLDDVLFLPRLRKNLISITQLAMKGVV